MTICPVRWRHFIFHYPDTMQSRFHRHLTAIAILGRLNDRAPTEFGPPQHSIIQRLLKTLRIKAAHQLIAGKMDVVAPRPEQSFRPIPVRPTGNISR